MSNNFIIFSVFPDVFTELLPRNSPGVSTHLAVVA
jgi:hypothetical protein